MNDIRAVTYPRHVLTRSKCENRCNREALSAPDRTVAWLERPATSSVSCPSHWWLQRRCPANPTSGVLSIDGVLGGVFFCVELGITISDRDRAEPARAGAPPEHLRAGGVIKGLTRAPTSPMVSILSPSQPRPTRLATVNRSPASMWAARHRMSMTTGARYVIAFCRKATQPAMQAQHLPSG